MTSEAWRALPLAESLGKIALQFPFPDPRAADETGLLAFGGDLCAERLLAAYSSGIFPWYDEDPILWFSPDPRMVLPLDALHVSRSLGKRIRSARFEVRFDTAFERVVAGCAAVKRIGQRGTWITPDMQAAYGELHRLGFAHSVESWRGGRLVGGLYGVSLGAAFFGESMFALEPDASKVALVALVERLRAWRFALIDCQVHTHHLESLGAEEWSRDRFLDLLPSALAAPTHVGAWTTP